MALAAVSFHSAQRNTAPHKPKTRARGREVEEQVTHAGLRAQETPPLGARPGIGPQRSHRSRRHFPGDDLPTLSLPVLAGASGEAVDSSALPFLTAQARDAKRKEEEEAKRRKTHATEQAARQELRSLLAVPRSRRTTEHESRLNAVS